MAKVYFFCFQHDERIFSDFLEFIQIFYFFIFAHFGPVLDRVSFDPLLTSIRKKLISQISDKIEKVHFGPFFPNLGQTGIFPKNRALSLLSVYGPLTSCKISIKHKKKSSSLGPIDSCQRKNTHPTLVDVKPAVMANFYNKTRIGALVYWSFVIIPAT